MRETFRRISKSVQLPDPPPPKISLRSTIKIVAAYIIVVIVRSLNQFFISDIVQFMPPTAYLGIRSIVAIFLFIITVAIVLNFAAEKDAQNVRNFWAPVNRTDACLKLWIMAVFESSIPLCGYSYADIYLPADVATVLLSISPLCSFFFRWIFPKIDPDLPPFLPTRKVVLGILVGFIGAAIVVARPYLSSRITHQKEKSLVIGDPWVVGAFIFAVISLAFSTTYWSTYGNYLSPKKEKIGVFAAGLFRNIFGFIALIPFMLVTDYFIPFVGKKHWEFYDQLQYSRSWSSIMWMGIGPAYINIITYYYLVQKMGAEKSLTTNFLVPVLGNIIGLVYLEEYKIYNAYDYVFQFGGAIIVILGLILVTMDGLKRRKEPRVRKNIVDTGVNSDSSYRGPTTSDTESGWDIASFKKYPRM